MRLLAQRLQAPECTVIWGFRCGNPDCELLEHDIGFPQNLDVLIHCIEIRFNNGQGSRRYRKLSLCGRNLCRQIEDHIQALPDALQPPRREGTANSRLRPLANALTPSTPLVECAGSRESVNTHRPRQTSTQHGPKLDTFATVFHTNVKCL